MVDQIQENVVLGLILNFKDQSKHTVVYHLKNIYKKLGSLNPMMWKVLIWMITTSPWKSDIFSRKCENPGKTLSTAHDLKELDDVVDVILILYHMWGIWGVWGTFNFSKNLTIFLTLPFDMLRWLDLIFCA